MNLDRYKPISLDKVVGQDIVKLGLISMLKRPNEAPKWLCIAGPSGTGRKTLARNYIRSLYCQNRESSLSNCGTCEICKNILSQDEVYKEYDWSEIDRIENHNYIMIKNFESCPRYLQQDLFNWWNIQEDRPTIILITEDTSSLIDDINNISFILRTKQLTQKEIEENLKNYNIKDNSNLTDEIISIVARRSRGNLLYAHRFYEIYRTQDKETFKTSLMSARELYIAFLISCYENNRDNIDKAISRLKEIPLAYLKIDYEALIVEILKVYTKFEEPKDDYIKRLITVCKNRVLDLYYILNDKIIYNSFQNDDTFQSAMYVIYLKLIEKLR